MSRIKKTLSNLLVPLVASGTVALFAIQDTLARKYHPINPDTTIPLYPHQRYEGKDYLPITPPLTPPAPMHPIPPSKPAPQQKHYNPFEDHSGYLTA